MAHRLATHRLDRPGTLKLPPLRVALSVHRRGRCLQDQLVERQVEPASELESRLLHDAAGSEAQALVQFDAHGVGGIYATHHDVVLLLLRRLDHGLEQATSDSLAAETAIHIHGMLDGVLVGRPRAERTVTRESEEI